MSLESMDVVQAIESLELHPVRLAMRHRFRRVDHREAVLVRGPLGWGEFSPFPEYPPSITARWLASALEAACSPLPLPQRRRVPVNVTVPAVDAATAADIVVRSGCSTAKVKVAERGQGPAHDLRRVAAVREAIGDGKVRIDANGAWDVDTAVARITELDRFDLEYVEQPVASLDDLRRVRERVGVPIAADESLRSAADPLDVIRSGAVDVVVIKVQPMGGIRRTIELAAEAGIPVVVSSALESSIGMYSGVLAAASLPDPSHACGLGTVSLLADDVVLDRLEPVDGWIEVRRPEPDPALLERHRPHRERAAEMLRKVRAAAELLT